MRAFSEIGRRTAQISLKEASGDQEIDFGIDEIDPPAASSFEFDGSMNRIFFSSASRTGSQASKFAIFSPSGRDLLKMIDFSDPLEIAAADLRGVSSVSFSAVAFDEQGESSKKSFFEFAASPQGVVLNKKPHKKGE
jgi:hypothetical protein